MSRLLPSGVRKWGFALVVVVLVAAAAVLVVRPYLAERERCDQVRAYLAQYGMTRTVGDGPRSVVALGDSYLTGDLLPDREDRWVVRFADETDATVRANGLGYTGYANAGACGDAAFPSRSDKLDTAPLTVVAGGLNDVDADADDLEEAGGEVLGDLSGSVLVVGPVDAPARDGEADVDEVLAAAAEEAGATYLSLLDLEPGFVADGVHMTAEGHAAYAAAIVQAARPLLR